MYIGEKYKVGVIYNKDNLTLVRITCKVSATDENIYKTLKSLAPLIDCAEPYYEVQTIFRHILDEAPPSEKPTGEEAAEDVKIVVPKGEFILKSRGARISIQSALNFVSIREAICKRH